MIRFALALLLVVGSMTTVHAADAKTDACTEGQQNIATRVKTFHGEHRIAQLIEGDLERASQEQAEGDTDECLEALVHADKLLRGEF
ncbi:MAG TPA: hypothetical protein PLD10_25460 [Rhodopila sp.]|nr:hypothetical protein [Rhodopila sp.]